MTDLFMLPEFWFGVIIFTLVAMCLTNLFDQTTRIDVEKKSIKVRSYKLKGNLPDNYTPSDIQIPLIEFVDVCTLPGGDSIDPNNTDLRQFVRSNKEIPDEEKEILLENVGLEEFFEKLKNSEKERKRSDLDRLFNRTLTVILLLAILAVEMMVAEYPKWLVYVYTAIYLIASVANIKFFYTCLAAKIIYPIIGIISLGVIMYLWYFNNNILTHNDELGCFLIEN